MSDLYAALRKRDNEYRLLNGLKEINTETIQEHVRVTIKENKIEIAKVTDGFHCKKCGENSMIRRERQDRASDEGASLVYTCTNPSCEAERKS